MDNAIKIINSVATLLWPLIAIVIFLYFRPAIQAIIESAKTRKFTLKIGGQELTMEEASEQQRFLLDDVQSQIADLRRKMDVSGKPIDKQEETQPDVDECLYKSILWIDDHPKNNSYFIEQLGERGISVDIALSTSEGIAKYKKGKYICIFSDMGRKEKGEYQEEAGIQLLSAIRKIDPDIPFYFYCSAKKARKFGQKAKELGATGISSSSSDLYYLLNLDRIFRK